MPYVIETLLPKTDLRTRYEVTIAATPERVYQAARTVPLMQVGMARWLLWLRALPARLDRKPSSENSNSLLLLREENGREIVWGLAGRFWHPSRNIARLPDAKTWLRYIENGSAKAAVNYLVEPLAGGQTRLSTETRVACFGGRALLLFRAYWLVVGPFSGCIRRSWLNEVKNKSEV